MKKEEMVEILINSPAWDGTKDKKTLMKEYSKEEIKEYYDELETMEDEYFNSIYC